MYGAVEDIRRLGRYEVRDIVGRGAMGVVYHAYDTLIERDVAIKVIWIPPWMSEDEAREYRARFFREAKAAGRLQHPNIVAIYDIGFDEQVGVPFIVMELIRGDTLKVRFQQQGPLPWPLMLEITRQIAEGLAFAHSEGIVHRDIKPSNIMLLPQGLVKITDFGIARIPASDLTRTGQMLGSPSYMAPEQVRGQHVTSQADLFSLGVVFFEGLTGQKPFPGDTIGQITYRILNEPPLNLRELRPDIPESVAEIVERLLAKEPVDRFESASDLARSIRRCQWHWFRETFADVKDFTFWSPMAPVPKPETDASGVFPSLKTATFERPTGRFFQRFTHWFQTLHTRTRWAVVGLLLAGGLTAWFLWGLGRLGPPPSKSVNPITPGRPHSTTSSPSLEKSGQVDTSPPSAQSRRTWTPPTRSSPLSRILSSRQSPCLIMFQITHNYRALRVQVQIDGTRRYDRMFPGRIKRIFGPIKKAYMATATDTLQVNPNLKRLVFYLSGEGEFKGVPVSVPCRPHAYFQVSMTNLKGKPIRDLTLRPILRDQP